MKWRDILRGIVIGVFIAALAISFGQCSQYAQAAKSSETVVVDWKQCNTKLIIANDTKDLYYYLLYWLDHDVKDWDGYMNRAGGEVLPYGINKMSKQFRLCPGRHVMLWCKRGTPDVQIMKFMVQVDMTSIILLPTGAQPKFNYFYEAPDQEDI